MATYTNHLKKIDKRDMVNIVLSLQSKLDEANEHVVEEIRKLSDVILKLQQKFAVSRQVSSLLLNRLISIERQCWANIQYSRGECLDVIDIPSEEDADILEEKVLSIFGKLGCDIPPERIETCHRISKKSSTLIVKFTKKKDCQIVWRVKKVLQKIKIEDVNLPGQNKLLIYRILCPYYKVLWSKSKKLHSLGKIFSFYISSDAIKMKVNENIDDFGKYLPDVNLSLPERFE